MNVAIRQTELTQTELPIATPQGPVRKLRHEMARLMRVNAQQAARITELEAEAEGFWEDCGPIIGDLARVYTMVKTDRKADALYELDRILCERDSAWRTVA